MAQLHYCRECNVAYGGEFRGRSCPACGEELIHGRVPAGRSNTRKRASHAGVGRAVWDHIIKKDPCAYCGIKLPSKEITIDHIQPKALGGSKGSWTNRTASCRPCNADKAHTPLLHFMLEQRGVDLSHLKDEDGNWPIPEIRSEEEHVSPAHDDLPIIDPRRLVATMNVQVS